jgi:hypothetical protein
MQKCGRCAHSSFAIVVARCIRGAVCVAGAAACPLLSSCAGVVPMSTHTQTSSNQEIKQKIKTNFVVPGQTTKADVLANLKLVDTGVESDTFFLARWSSSNTGGWLFLCGYIDCVGGTSRLWKTTNALVEFDDHNLVTRYAVFSDGSLVAKLSPLAAQEKIVSFDVPREIQVEHISHVNEERYATLILASDTFEVRESGKKASNFQINRAAVTGVRVGRYGSGQFPRTVARINFREKTKTGNSLLVRLSVPDLFLLLEFCNQHG